MIVLRILGYLLLLAGITALGVEILNSLEAGEWAILSAGEIWARIDRESLRATQVGLERYIHPYLWDPIMLNIVLAPAWLVLGLPGLILILLARRRRSRRMFS
ncbi:hypothetical protein [Minwuia thermotolerans]|uniref:Uncharacterized protein n=1 Tax=Minwuia thermotolerans TaxID=2056226 RepID=A0A2M9G1J8_9PROT|nr:hypothetical protein [Minwuia thermotolerans]PJK29585.1 hypothetical protein CVT23_11040 [Minwuia thermotolerans]